MVMPVDVPIQEHLDVYVQMVMYLMIREHVRTGLHVYVLTSMNRNML